jgi:hypothetical protein
MTARASWHASNVTCWRTAELLVSIVYWNGLGLGLAAVSINTADVDETGLPVRSMGV